MKKVLKGKRFEDVEEAKQKMAEALNCNHPRPDTFMGFGQMEEKSQNHWDVRHDFILGWGNPHIL